jgi:hypothetical protein
MSNTSNNNNNNNNNNRQQATAAARSSSNRTQQYATRMNLCTELSRKMCAADARWPARAQQRVKNTRFFESCRVGGYLGGWISDQGGWVSGQVGGHDRRRRYWCPGWVARRWRRRRCCRCSRGWWSSSALTALGTSCLGRQRGVECVVVRVRAGPAVLNAWWCGG